MSTTKKTLLRKQFLLERLSKLGFSEWESTQLIRIERTLQRWGELECGTGTDRLTVSIERDEKTGKPKERREWKTATGYQISWSFLPDREKGAIERLNRIVACRNNRGLDRTVIAFHQTDCRGCNVYLLTEDQLKPGDDISSLYTRGLAVCF